MDTVPRSEYEPVLDQRPGTHLVQAVLLAVDLYEGGPGELPVPGLRSAQDPPLGHWPGEATGGEVRAGNYQVVNLRAESYSPVF